MSTKVLDAATTQTKNKINFHDRLLSFYAMLRIGFFADYKYTSHSSEDFSPPKSNSRPHLARFSADYIKAKA